MTSSGWLAVGAVAASLFGAQLSIASLVLLATALAVGAAGIRLSHRSRIRRGWLRAATPAAIGSIAIAIRLASLGGPPTTDGAALPDGSGPWTAVVVTVSSPREGSQVATVRLETEDPTGAGAERRPRVGDRRAGRVQRPRRRHPAALPRDRAGRPSSARRTRRPRRRTARTATTSRGSASRARSTPGPSRRSAATRTRRAPGTAPAVRPATPLRRRSRSPRPASRRGSSSASATASTATSRRRSRRSAPATSSRSRAGTSRSSPRRSRRSRDGSVAGGEPSSSSSRSSPTSCSRARRHRSFGRPRWPASCCSRARPAGPAGPPRRSAGRRRCSSLVDPHARPRSRLPALDARDRRDPRLGRPAGPSGSAAVGGRPDPALARRVARRVARRPGSDAARSSC